MFTAEVTEENPRCFASVCSVRSVVP